MKKALIVYGGWAAHEPKEVSLIFKDILEGEGFIVDLSDSLESYSNEQKLKEYSLIIPAFTMGTIKSEYIDNISNAVASGVGMAGCHGGMCDAFRESTTWHFMTGSQWVAHPGNDNVEYTVNIKKSSDSPIIEGMDDFKVVSEQYYLHVDPAVNVLATTGFPIADDLHTSNGAVDMPVIYTKRWGKGRLYYNSLGHTASIISQKEVRELMRRGFLWASK